MDLQHAVGQADAAAKGHLVLTVVPMPGAWKVGHGSVVLKPFSTSKRRNHMEFLLILTQRERARERERKREKGRERERGERDREREIYI